MVPILSLIWPILLAAVLVFIASSIFHMVLPLHQGDYGKVSNQGEVQEALRRFNIPPGDYMLPSPQGTKGMNDPAFIEAMTKGPSIIMTVIPNGPPAMGASLAQWFAYCCVIGVFAAYIAGRALGPGASYLEVFRFAGATAFAGYWLAQVQSSIWYKRSWRTTLVYGFDSLVYAMLTAGAFGWLWPR